MKPAVTISYCVGCNWLLRAGWMAQELLQTFGDALHGVTIAPAEVPGTYRIEVDGKTIWDRKRDGGFPETKEIKKRLRHVIDPERDLGHLDR
ncbi:selenoprotein W-related protein [Shimia isoporae]|uniref:Selenoprotein W-related protein n=1 Tax=Shimia isoporae TaxID=647720 RepID=A0A4R1N4I7_9RHOB|nr:SelT/SelW/SelH family protein [Shimia isoporae]TCL01586.1 selenoprotein W-related protein [Shimia isoporae]